MSTALVLVAKHVPDGVFAAGAPSIAVEPLLFRELHDLLIASQRIPRPLPALSPPLSDRVKLADRRCDSDCHPRRPRFGRSGHGGLCCRCY